MEQGGGHANSISILFSISNFQIMKNLNKAITLSTFYSIVKSLYDTFMTKNPWELLIFRYRKKAKLSLSNVQTGGVSKRGEVKSMYQKWDMWSWNMKQFWHLQEHEACILQCFTLQKNNIPFWPKKLACFMSVPTLQWPTYLCFISMTASGCNAQMI